MYGITSAVVTEQCPKHSLTSTSPVTHIVTNASHGQKTVGSPRVQDFGSNISLDAMGITANAKCYMITLRSSYFELQIRK